MKKIATIIPLLLVIFFSVEAKQGNLYLLDAVDTVVFSPEGTEIITKSDIDRPSLTGGIRTRDDIIFERLIKLDAIKYKISANESELDRYLAMVQRENNLPLDDLKAIFNQAGYTYQEGREQFQMMQTINSMVDFKIRANLIVPRKEVEKYYYENPEKEEASYFIQYALVPYSPNKDKKIQKRQLMQYAKTGTGISGIPWGDPFWVNASDIAQDKKFIAKMRPGTISLPQETTNGFELYRLKDSKSERLLSLDERYRDITEILRRPKYEELLQKYRDSLFDAASMIHLS